ncbi:MAG: WecB/TagA/CpsF family glycosyltransferase [Patescibacteria group bacterium]
MSKVLVSKVPFDKITLEEAANKAVEFAKGSVQKQICTPNPEMILEARKNPKFLEILKKSALNIPDGIGILWAAKYLKITEKNHSKIVKAAKWLGTLATIPFYSKYIKTELPERVTGVDLMQEICKKAAKENLKFFLLGAQEGVAERTKEILQKKYPSLKITETHAGSPHLKDEKEILNLINKSEAQILFVAFGAPQQEIWISRNLKHLKSVKVAIGVGGSFDFIAGIRKRAPKLLQKLGLEWLYRLVQEPKRIKRIYNATIKFPFKIF